MNANTLAKLDYIQTDMDKILTLIQASKESAKNAAKVDKQRDPKAIPTAESVKFLDLLMPQLECLFNESQSLSRQHRLLCALSFKTIRMRHSSIKDAHASTFKWALPDQHDFARWLRSGRGIYWIKGKAGSGKSTLMRFVSQHPLSLEYLTEWAQDQRPIIASHYFWHAGNSLQKSQVGLLRTLLFGIFKQCPELIESTCPVTILASAEYTIDPVDRKQSPRGSQEAVPSQHYARQVLRLH